MWKEPWHRFKEGEHVKRGTVVLVCENHIRSGGVKDQKHHMDCVRVIRDCPFSTLVFRPFAKKGWGRSPMDPSCWKTLDGQSIWFGYPIPNG